MSRSISIDHDFGRYLERQLSALGVYPLDHPVIFGSAVMKLHGLKDVIGDVDVFVTPAAYHRLRQRREWVEERPRPEDPPYLRAIFNDGGLPIAAFHSWTCRDAWLDVPEAIGTATRVAGLLCVKLELVAKWKYEAVLTTQAAGIQIEGSPWEKHIADFFTLQAAGVDTSGLLPEYLRRAV